MKISQDPIEIHAYVDEELDVSSQLAMERAMARDPTLRTRVQEMRDVRGAIHSGADYHTTPDALRHRIETMALAGSALPAPDEQRPASAIAPTVGRPLQPASASWMRWWGWRPLAAACAATVALTFAMQFYFARENRAMQLADAVVASHVRSTLSEHLIDIASSNRHTVKPWLSSKLDFSPPVRDTGIGNAIFLGGRVDYLDGRPVAALVYQVGPHLVDAFIWPGSGDRRVSITTERGFQIAHWVSDGMNHWVVSDVNRAEFVELINRLAVPIEEAPAR